MAKITPTPTSNPEAIIGQSGIARSLLAHGLIELAASLIVVDGPLNREEFSAFRVLFPMPAKRDLKARQWLQQGLHNPIHPREARVLLGPLLIQKPGLREEILARFIALAWADASVYPSEHEWLREFTDALSLEQGLLVELLNLVQPYSRERDPYNVLEVDENASDIDIKRAWQRQIRAFHPDALAAQGLPIEEQEEFGQRMTEINAAYDKILKSRGMR